MAFYIFYPPFLSSLMLYCSSAYNTTKVLNVSMIYARIFLRLIPHNDIVEKNVLSCLVIELAMNLHERRQNKSSNPRF